MQAQDREYNLRHKAIGPLFLSYSLPAVVGMVVQALYNVIDRFFVGNIPEVGAVAIGALGVALPVIFLTFGMTMLFGIGAAANISIKLGQGDREGAYKIFGNAMLMLFLSSLTMNLIIQPNIEFILKLFGATEGNLPFAKTYLRIYLIGNMWNTFAFAFNHITRAEGNPKRAMVAMFIGAGSNIVLDFLFINIFHWGVAGAAYATIIAQFLSFSWGAIYFFRNKSSIQFKRRYLKPDFSVIKRIISIGFSPFFMQMGASLIGLILNNSLKLHGGELAQGAYAIINSVSSLFFMPIFGMNQGMQPIVGYNYGAGDYDRVKQAFKVALRAALVVMTIGWIVVQFFTSLLVTPMTNDPELRSLTQDGMRLFLLMMPIVAPTIIGSTFFQAIGKAKLAFITTVCRQFLILIPLLLVLPRFFGLRGIWYSPIISDSLTFLIVVYLLRREFKRMEDGILEPDELEAKMKLKEQGIYK